MRSDETNQPNREVLSGRAWALLALAGVLLWSGYARVVDLGSARFHGDELDIVYAAQGLETEGRPLLPSGREYRRAVDFSWIVTPFVEDGRTDEFAARLPAAIFGLASLVLFALLAWWTGGPWVAVWATVLLAIYPEHFHESRRLRFYTYQLTFVIAALSLGWAVVRHQTTQGTSVVWRWAALLGSVICFAIALRAQVTTVSVISGYGAALASLGLQDQWGQGWETFKQNVPLQAAVAAAIGFFSIFVLDPGFFPTLWERSQQVPRWTSAGDPRFYYWALSGSFPIAVRLFPVSVIVVWLRAPRLTLFAVLVFVVPVLLHSFFLPWKGERFIIGAVPGFLLVSGYAASVGARELFRAIERVVSDRWQKRPAPQAIAGTVTAIAALFALATNPAFDKVRSIPPSYLEMDWPRAWDVVNAAVSDEDMPVGTSRPLEARYYWPRVDFTVGVDLLPGTPPRGEKLWRDIYADLPILGTPAEIRQVYPGADYAVVVVDTGKIQGGDIAPRLIELLNSQTDLCNAECGALRVFLIPLPQLDES